MATEIEGGGSDLDSAGRDWNHTPLPPLVAREIIEANDTPIRVVVYLEDGQEHRVDAASPRNAQFIAQSAITDGIQFHMESHPNIEVFYPPHRVLKVKIIAPVQ